MSIQHDVKDLNLADEGREAIEWADRQMPVLRLIRERFEREKPLDGVTLATCLHVTTETANLMRTLKADGASVYLAASNSLSTQDTTAATLVQHYGVSTFAIHGEGRLVNLAAAEGHPGAVMDMSFANQALRAEYMMANAKTLEKKVYSVPLPIDEEIARLKLHSMGVSIDLLTAKQEKYLASSEEGT